MDLFLCPAQRSQYRSHLAQGAVQACHREECVVTTPLGSKGVCNGPIKQVDL